jgi:hypothetical protein
MIHYHGGPIWPETAAVQVWNKRHGFISFARPEQIGAAATVCQSFALDNGAYSLWKSKKPVDWDGYISWVSEWCNHPGFDFALIPDMIDGCEKDNRLLLDKWTLGEFFGVPVWHLHESINYLIFLTKNFPRVALGSSGEYSKVGTKKWWVRMAYAMDCICDKKGRPPCKLHGLRMLNYKIFTIFPFSSCDSTNVAQNCRDSSRWGTYNPPNNETRGIVIAERIESHNSSAEWKHIPIQSSLLSLDLSII